LYFFGAIWLASAWTLSKPGKILVSARQDNSLFGHTMFVSIFGKTIIFFAGLITILILMEKSNWYTPQDHEYEGGKLKRIGIENTVLFFTMILYQPIFVFCVYSKFAAKQSLY
jgi:hypothetical protein